MSIIARSFFARASTTPNRIAISCDGSSVTFNELADLVGRWSYVLCDRGVVRGDHIGVLLPNCIEFVTLMLVASDIGAVLVPLNTSLPHAAVFRAFQASDVKHVVARANTLKALISSEHHFADGLWFSTDGEIPGIQSLDQLIKTIPPQDPMFGGRDSDPYILTMTSGSTGAPKPIVLTQQNKYSRALAAIELYTITGSDNVLAATPLYHSLAERLVLIPLMLGGTSVLMARFSPSEWVRHVRERKVSFTIAVSSQLRQIAEHIRNEPTTDLTSMRCLVSSSAPLDLSVKADLVSRLDCEFHECYGTSEIAIATDLNCSAADARLKSVGVAAPGVDLRILRDGGGIALPMEVGEIACKTPMCFGGYYKRPDLTDESMEGEYFRTGDTGKMDENGYLYYLGRNKDIIITGGINVYPKDIEGIIIAHPSVLECCAFPLPDDHLGEIVAVAVVPTNHDSFDLKQIRRHCAEHLADFQQPRKYFLQNDLPKNALGKIHKHSVVARCVSTRPYKLASKEVQRASTIVNVGGVGFGGAEFVVIAGPCSVESEPQIIAAAQAVKAAGARVLRGGAFKPRTSPYAFHGLGEKGLELLARAREATGLPVVTEVLDIKDIDVIYKHADMFQVGARNIQNFALLTLLGQADKPVLLKRGMSTTIEEFLMAAEYILAGGNGNVVLCERGVRTFETATRNTLDISCVPVVQARSHLPIIVDPSHAAGDAQYVPALAKAAVAVGADGLIIEVHPDPATALSDGAQSLNPTQFTKLMGELTQIAGAVGRNIGGRHCTTEEISGEALCGVS